MGILLSAGDRPCRHQWQGYFLKRVLIKKHLAIQLQLDMIFFESNVLPNALVRFGGRPRDG